MRKPPYWGVWSEETPDRIVIEGPLEQEPFLGFVEDDTGERWMRILGPDGKTSAMLFSGYGDWNDGDRIRATFERIDDGKDD